MASTDYKDYWPENELEAVPSCPICKSKRRRKLYKDLRDRTFFCAPGVWSLFTCLECGSGYLDPRPTAKSIGRAYSNYFTHSAAERNPYRSLGWIDRLRRLLANGYRNDRFGFQREPANAFGSIILHLFPNQRRILDADGRHIPRNHPTGRLLDVGCGHGQFLDDMQKAGWSVTGVDFDEQAVQTARLRGLDVRGGGVEAVADEIEKFDVVTLSHVIEHVYDPIEVLKICHKVIKPGGRLWLETPNLASKGHEIYGRNWMGLDPPRHLIHFTRSSLRRALSHAGFAQIEDAPYRPLCALLFTASEAITKGLDPIDNPILSKEGRKLVRKIEKEARPNPAVREYITVIAEK